MSGVHSCSNILIDSVEKLDQSATGGECFGALVWAAETLGFEGIAYTAIPKVFMPLPDYSPVFMVSGGFNQGFLKHYQEANFAQQDFTIERIDSGCLEPMDWAVEVARGNITQAQREVVDVAKEEYGINNAISVPLLNNNHFMAGASIVSDLSDNQFAALKEERLPTLMLITRLFHDKLFSRFEYRKYSYLPILQSLSCNEKKMLKLVAHGQRIKQSQELYGVSPTRAGNILSDLYKKLGVSNASELGYVLGIHKIIDML